MCKAEAAIAVAEAACDLIEKVGLVMRPNVSYVDFNAKMFNALAQACLDYAPYRKGSEDG